MVIASSVIYYICDSNEISTAETEKETNFSIDIGTNFSAYFFVFNRMSDNNETVTNTFIFPLPLLLRLKKCENILIGSVQLNRLKHRKAFISLNTELCRDLGERLQQRHWLSVTRTTVTVRYK